MIVGVPREIKDEEYRVAVTPTGVREFVRAGHVVIVERAAGVGSGFEDAAYGDAGAELADVEEVFARADMIVKVKEPLPVEWPRLRDGQILHTYLHLGAAYAKELTQALMERGVRGLAYETVARPDGMHPLLFPMSEVAGRLAIQAGATHLQKNHGGLGILLGGATGVPPAKVVIIGGGTVGFNAAKMSEGLRARTIVLDTKAERLAYFDDVFGGRVETVFSNISTIEEELVGADLVVGAVLLPGGAQAPHLVSREMLSLMQPGTVLVDVAIDQGGCFETSRPTTHSDPTYIVDGIIHYCVSNMPGAVARTSTMALTAATLPYGVAIASKGLEQAVEDDPTLALGVNVYRGSLTIPSVAAAHGLDYTPLHDVLAG